MVGVAAEIGEVAVAGEDLPSSVATIVDGAGKLLRLCLVSNNAHKLSKYRF